MNATLETRHRDMLRQIEKGQGFIAALDQSGGSTPKALTGYGYRGDEWSNDEEMFDLIHQMRSRIISSPSFGGGKVIGAILFERTMDGQVNGKPVPQALIDQGVVPFIKIDKGLEDEANGVQLMKPMPELDALLTRSRALGVFGTKERSVIHLANPEGIAAVVAQHLIELRVALVMAQVGQQRPAEAGNHARVARQLLAGLVAAEPAGQSDDAKHLGMADQRLEQSRLSRDR